MFACEISLLPASAFRAYGIVDTPLLPQRRRRWWVNPAPRLVEGKSPLPVEVRLKRILIDGLYFAGVLRGSNAALRPLVNIPCRHHDFQAVSIHPHVFTLRTLEK